MAKHPILVALLCGTALSASASNLGVAEGYNVLTFGNFSGTSDTQGRLAVGGDAFLTNFGLGSSLSSSDPLYPYTGVVAGNLTFTNGSSYDGGLAVGGNASLTNIAVHGNLSAGGTAVKVNGQVDGTTSSAASGTPTTIASLVDFSSYQSTITAESTAWAALAQTGTANNYYGTLTLTGTSSGLNVFNLTAAQLAAATGGLNINAPTGSTVLVNVEGANVSFPNTGYNVNGVAVANVLFNFSDATTLSGSGGFLGSILAPSAAFTFNNGQITGSVVVDSMSGSGETHLSAFAGSLPDVTATPEPGSLLLLSTGAALLGVGSILRKRQRSRVI